MEPLNLDLLRETLEKLFLPYKEEVSPGVWRIKGGDISVWTTEEGAKQFDKALDEEFKKIRNDFSDDTKGLDKLPGDKDNNPNTGVS